MKAKPSSEKPAARAKSKVPLPSIGPNAQLKGVFKFKTWQEHDRWVADHRRK